MAVATRKQIVNDDIVILNAWDMMESNYPNLSNNKRLYMVAGFTRFTVERIIEALKRNNPKMHIGGEDYDN